MENEALTAAIQGNLEKLEELLGEGININERGDNGQTLLHLSTIHGHHEIVKCLLENGADVLLTDDQNNTALHVAVAKGDVDLAVTVVNVMLDSVPRKKLRKLLNAKIKTNGTAALHLAAENDFYEQALLLLEFGADFEITNDAGEKPVDLAIGGDLRELFKLINSSFAKAKIGDDSLIGDIKQRDTVELNSVFNCRNKQGYTIMQVLVLKKPIKLDDITWDFLYLRTGLPCLSARERRFESTYDRSRASEMDQLAERVKKCREFWDEHFEAVNMCLETMTDYRRKYGMPPSVDPNYFCTNIVKLCCRYLEKAHEVLLAYRKFAGERMSLTADMKMKSVEEVLEVLGYDPDHLFVIVGDEACYFTKLPMEWKANYERFMYLIDGIVHASIDYFSYSLNTIRLIHAVNDDDLGKVRQIVENSPRQPNQMSDHNHRTVLCYAAERGNKKIVDLLLKAGAILGALENRISPVYLAANKGKAKVVKLLLENTDAKYMADFVDCSEVVERTALHAAAKKGHLRIAKILLRYGATYVIVDGKGRTPLDVSTSEEIDYFLNIVDECFEDAKEADVELIHKLKALDTYDFMAVAGCRNHEGQTLAMAAAKANAKNIAVIILRMIQKAKQEDE